MPGKRQGSDTFAVGRRGEADSPGLDGNADTPWHSAHPWLQRWALHSCRCARARRFL